MLYHTICKEIFLLAVFIFTIGGFIYKLLFSVGDMDGQNRDWLNNDKS